MKIKSFSLSIAIVVVLCLPVSSQEPATSQLIPSARSQSGPTADVEEGTPAKFTSRIREVNVTFSVSDWRGRFVSDLTPSDMKVVDNGQQPAALTYFLREDSLPLAVGVVIDVSDSVENFFRSQQTVASTFLRRTLRPSDSGFIVAFSNQPRIAQDLTGDIDSLTRAVHDLHPGGPSTAIYDAVKFSCERLARAGGSSPARRALILITDGEENSSHASADDAMFAAVQGEVVVFALNTSDSPTITDPLLRRLTERTGGSVLRGHGRRDLVIAFGSINRQLRSQYVLGYKPPHWLPDHTFHKIRLSARRRGLHVHCRKGYYAVE